MADADLYAQFRDELSKKIPAAFILASGICGACPLNLKEQLEKAGDTRDERCLRHRSCEGCIKSRYSAGICRTH